MNNINYHFKIIKNAFLFGLHLFILAKADAATCYQFASQRYNVSVVLLKAIAQQESGGRYNVVNLNKNGSRDIGLMQINSSWLPILSKHGVDERDLYDPCINTLVGAWILSENLNRLGYNTQGLGAYNASSPIKRENYAKQVLKNIPNIIKQQNQFVTSEE